MIGKQVVSTIFDIKTSIHMVRIILFEDWNEDPERLSFIYIISYPLVAIKDYLK